MSNTSSHTSTMSVIESAPGQGLFELTFTNSRKSGMRPVQTYHCQGTLYKSGHVHLDTRDTRANYFETLSQMCEYLEQFGYFKVSWEDNQ